MTIEITIPPDDLSVTVPEEKTEYTTWYATEYLTDPAGNKLTDPAGNYLVVTIPTIENVYVVNVATDDLSVTVPEES